MVLYDHNDWFLCDYSNSALFFESGYFFSEVGISLFDLSYLSFKTCSFSASCDDKDEGEKGYNDFSGEGGEKVDFSHELARSITKPVVFGRMCWTPVVTT